MAIDYKHFRKKLEAEKKTLKTELEAIGIRNPEISSDWQAVTKDRDVSQADDNTVADSVEELEENTAIVNTLETRYEDILSGLDKIKQGTYGLCEVDGKEIELDRLEANPAARTCKEHM